MKSGDARVALIGFPSVGKVLHATVLLHIPNFCVSKHLLSVMSNQLFLSVFCRYLFLHLISITYVTVYLATRNMIN